MVLAKQTALENRTLGEILADKARKNGAKALVHFKDEIASYEQMDERANRAANWFLSMGLEKGDKVVILLNNCLEWLYVWLGLAKIGVVADLSLDISSHSCHIFILQRQYLMDPHHSSRFTEER